MLFNIIETYLLFFELEAIARFFFFGSFIEYFINVFLFSSVSPLELTVNS